MDPRLNEARESEDVLQFTQFAMEHASIGILWLGADARIHYANNQACAYLGYTKHELLQLGIPDIDPLFPTEHWEAHWESLKRDKTQNFETQQKRKDGQVIPIEVTANYVKFGNLEYNVAYCTDITERKKTEQALRNATSEMHTLVHAIPDLVWLKDVDGVYLSCNARFESFFGKKEAEIVGKTDYDFVSKELADFYCENDRKAMMMGGPSVNAEWITFAEDGHQEYLQTTKTPVYSTEGKLIGVLGVGHDITALNKIENELRSKSDYLTAIFNNEPEGVKVVGLDGKLLDMNPAGLRMLEVDTLQEAQAIGLANFIDAGYQKLFVQLHKRVCAGNSGVLEFPVVGQKGTSRWLETHATPLFDQHGKVVSLIGITRDTTEQKAIRAALQESEERFRTLMESIPTVAVQGYTLDGTVTFWNKASEQLYGYSSHEALQHNLLDLIIPPEMKEGVTNAMQLMAETNVPIPSGELLLKTKDGTRVPVFSSHALLQPANGKPELFCLDIDLTERKQLEEKVRQLAFYDVLTKLPNRRLLNDRLTQAMATSKRSGCYGAVLFLDLDNFKPLNDAHGHAVGDLLLIDVASRLKSCVREIDTVARFGGDEFVVILSELEQDEKEATEHANTVANKILDSLVNPYVLSHTKNANTQSVTHNCSASIGGVMFISTENSQEDILRLADAAMYKAKEAGRNQIQFHQ